MGHSGRRLQQQPVFAACTAGTAVSDLGRHDTPYRGAAERPTTTVSIGVRLAAGIEGRRP